MIPAVHIWHGERNDNHIQFMYKPIVDNIVLLFNELNNIYPVKKINITINDYDLSSINKYDIFIWIGNEKIDMVPFKELTVLDVYTIYFNTEPGNVSCPYFEIDEIWTYSINNILITKYPFKCKVKFFFLILPITHETISYQNKSNLGLFHLGPLVKWNINRSREEKWNLLKKSEILKERLHIIDNVWTDEAFNLLLNNNNFGIIINIHKKGCNSLESVRINKLLNHKLIIISEHCCLEEEYLYKNLVFFCNINQVELIFKRLIQLSKLKIQLLSDYIYQQFRLLSTNHINSHHISDTYISSRNLMDTEKKYKENSNNLISKQFGKIVSTTRHVSEPNSYINIGKKHSDNLFNYLHMLENKS